MDIPKPVSDVLEPTETLLWLGGPRTDYLFVPSDACMTLPLAIASIAVTFVSHKLWFVLVGLLMIFATNILYDLFRRRNTHYFVTDRRVVVKRNFGFDKTHRSTRYDKDFTMTAVNVRRNATTIYFGRASAIWNFFYPPNRFLFDNYLPNAFVLLNDADSVMAKIDSAVLNEGKNSDGSHP